MAFLILASLAIIISIAWVMRLTIRPMTVSFTFDDGLKAHLEIAAPLLEKYGWIGAFNICTDFCDAHPSSLSPEKLKTLSIDDNPSRRLDWNDVKTLLARGHEVYPHTCSHANLEELDKAGKDEVLLHEILDAKCSYERHLGAAPIFFCCPHLAWTPKILAIVRRNGMELFNNWRPGIGEMNKSEVVGILKTLHKEGRHHVDLMFHGLVQSEGGHAAFSHANDFSDIVNSVRELEMTGVIKVVPYKSAHFGPSRFAEIKSWIEWLRKKIRRVVFCVLNKLIVV